MDRVKQTLEASRAVCPRIVSWPTLVLESRVIRWHLRKCFYCIPRGESTYVPALFQTVTAIAAPGLTRQYVNLDKISPQTPCCMLQ